MGEEDAQQLRADPVIAEALARALDAVRPGIDAVTMAAALDRGRDAGGPGRRWWTLDPVDGTKGFLRGEQYAVALALVEDGEPRVAVLGCPNLPTGDGSAVGSLFVAERDAGAWEMPLDDPAATPRRIHVDGDPDVTHARYAESVEAAHTDQDDSARIASLLGITGTPVRMDSQAKYAVVARGDASIYLRIPRGGYNENVWDHAAGLLVVKEAGGIVTRRGRSAARLHDGPTDDREPGHRGGAGGHRGRRHRRRARGPGGLTALPSLRPVPCQRRVAPRSSLTRADIASSCEPSGPSESTRALATMTPSATGASVRAWAGFETPNPTATGTGLTERTVVRNRATPGGRDVRAPVTPASETA